MNMWRKQADAMDSNSIEETHEGSTPSLFTGSKRVPIITEPVGRESLQAHQTNYSSTKEIING